ncbi:hypothetical protein MPTK1_7g06580 [Marchantia polymorpha subsp. ruderalis]|uniref:Secreted protein n=2 Tax=Marchantia polymorpha TaxID=3197 RepID=A0AAF6BWT7_MARPO|nr:hypothetical protein MARPO_0057s0009 [Marchantia polymorpha]BBN16471.1 hypothetical protein Mp_7g06580 [Marchantia polymorpha subsp. ruderalis]|eukprot:PTQ37366.1 hypothetical protein MARPO_0057s0009 [Marchantia polymorpha]
MLVLVFLHLVQFRCSSCFKAEKRGWRGIYIPSRRPHAVHDNRTLCPSLSSVLWELFCGRFVGHVNVRNRTSSPKQVGGLSGLRLGARVDHLLLDQIRAKGSFSLCRNSPKLVTADLVADRFAAMM